MKFCCCEDRFSLKSHNSQISSSSSTSLVISLVSVEFFVLTSTTQICSSFPGKVFTIQPRGHLALSMFSSITNTRLSMRKSLLSQTHFWHCCNVGIYSFIHLFQKQSARNWVILHCFLLWRSSWIWADAEGWPFFFWVKEKTWLAQPTTFEIQLIQFHSPRSIVSWIKWCWNLLPVLWRRDFTNLRFATNGLNRLLSLAIYFKVVKESDQNVTPTKGRSSSSRISKCKRVEITAVCSSKRGTDHYFKG